MQTTNALSTLKMAQDLGLLESEFESIKVILGRTPNFTELSIFSVMWSEHCSYKNSIKWLKTLPREGNLLLVEAGEENAGLVDIGDGLACAFKIESHNHPSAIEPFQGAATGVGGIHRDIFTMGARPIAALNSLRFGDIANKHTQHLMKGVVSGISHYGNCFGVPTVGGEVYFNECYNQNILVNAMSVGIVKVGETVSAISCGVGNPIYIVGSATGKDGIHGATFASADLTEDSKEDLPAVQVGDPFQEKLLLEASLEAIKTGAIVGMQDMGAAGITCSTSEMSAKGESGMIIYLDKVPTRQPNMKPFEILLSESQERMLIVCEKGREADLEAVFDKWDLECAVIGKVTDTKRIEYYLNGELVADVPAEPLVLGGGAPVYDRAYTEPAYLKALNAFNENDIPELDLKTSALTLVASPNIASKRWVYEQYDSMVRTNTITTNAPSDAAIIRIKGSSKVLAVTTDCNSAYVYADPYKGTMIAVAEAARNIVCSGGTPVAITNCLNFGNPYNTEVYWQFVHAIKGMGEACRKFNTPVTGGNVSFYNQTVLKDTTEPVFPTPTIGMLGILDDISAHMTLDFKAVGHSIYLVGRNDQNTISGSEYLRVVHGVNKSPIPSFDLEEEFQFQEVLKGIIGKKLVASAHDISEGGLFIALLESGLPSDQGFTIQLQGIKGRKDGILFGESQSKAIVTVDELNEAAFIQQLKEHNQSYTKLGTTTDGEIRIDDINFGKITDWKKQYLTSIEKQLH